jgi:phospholipid/cholesterol/gamma-HCH transport system substrate-binding protein
MKSSTAETLIGAAVIAIAAIFFVFAYQASGQGGTAQGLRLTAEFENAAGINVGTDVRMAGVKVGTVTGFALNQSNYLAQVTMQVDPRLKLTDDATAKVTSEGLLGSNFITLEQGGSDTILADGGVISITQGAVDIWSLISEAMFARKSDGSSGDGTEPQAQ